MSSREETRNLRKAIGATAAEAISTASAEVMKVRAAQLQLIEAVAVCDKRTREQLQRVEAALKLGFENEKAIGAGRTHVLKLADEQRAYVDRGDAEFRRFSTRTFWGRLRWLVTGR